MSGQLSIFRLFIAFSLSVPLLSGICAEPLRILSLLEQGRMEELALIRETAEGTERNFLDAVFEPDGEEAIRIYQEIWDNHRSNPLAWESLRRLYEFHYALGSYNRASKLSALLKNRPVETVPSTASNAKSGGRYWIQVGAYSIAANAQKQAAKLKSMGYSVKLVEKKSAQQTLHIVRVGGYENRSQAAAALEAIEAELGTRVRLIEESP